MEIPEPTCPNARRVEGATPALGGCVCTAMEADRAKADSVLEGAPVGVMIRVKDDPSTYFNLCAGQGQPVTTPEDLQDRGWGQGHYTGCPVYAATVELAAAERAFAPKERAPTSAGGVGPERVTADDLEFVPMHSRRVA